MFPFTVDAQDPATGPRLGCLTTPHGQVRTPVFMPIGTAASVKGVTPAQLAETGTRMILANTYHLRLRPGADVVADQGGLHRFMGWKGPILTDSGGYQVFSLAELNEITDDGVTFRSHIDGAKIHLDPDIAMDIQRQLGADVIMAFDQCPPIPCPRQQVEEAVDRTVRWARRCREVHRSDDQALFGIVQGGVFTDLRQRCAERLIEIGFDGYAIGGLSVGESHAEMIDMLERITPHLPADRPRYLMGVGKPRDLYEAVKRGIDMFDCVIPTRNGRNAWALTRTGRLKMRNAVHTRDQKPIEEGCECYTCRHFSRAYLRHMFMADEMLGPTLTSIHNLHLYQKLMARMRELIPAGKLDTISAEFPVVASGDV
ncbi:MAG: tRNA guanosine(34) transglycosylase Tgt [Phycisphaerae bacterium]